MGYLHCHKCGWSQDDFWDKRYNAIRFLLYWEDYLLNEKFHQEFIGELDTKGLTYQEVIARELENHAKTIRNMRWQTYDDFKKDYDAGIAKCPECGSSKDFDID
jgi:hypothetical protein